MEGVEGGQHPAGDQVVELLFIRREALRVDALRRGDDGMVVGDLGFIHRALGDGELPAGERMRHQGLIGCGQQLHRLHDAGHHVRRKIPAVRTGIGDGLAGFVEGLGGFQRFVRREAQEAVRIPLQAGKVVKLGRRILLADGFGGLHRACAALQPGCDGLRIGDLGNVCVRVELFVEPHALVVPEIRGDGGVLLGLELLDFLPALDQQRQGRRLHASDGKERVVAQCKGAGGVHAHQPVRLGAALGGSEKTVVLVARLNLPETLGNGLVGHGGDPQAVEGLAAASLRVDIAEDQFTLAPRVCRTDDTVGVRRVDEGLDDLVLIGGLADHLQRDVLRQNGEGLELPALVLLVQLVRLHQRHQMAHGPGDSVVLPDQAALPALIAPQHASDVPAHAGLLSNDDGAAHGDSSLPSLLQQRIIPYLTRLRKHGIMDRKFKRGCQHEKDWPDDLPA